MDLQITIDGKKAYNPENQWIYKKQPNGQWVTLRKATPQEIYQARQARRAFERAAIWAPD